MNGSIRVFLFLVMLLGSSVPALGQYYVRGLAPDWNQPLDYPDSFDMRGPMAGDWYWDAWCAPAAASGLIGHWEDVRNRNGLSDGSADGNQSIPFGYRGPRWGMGPGWHDYCADGLSTGWGGHPMRGFRPVDDLGVYLDTQGHMSGIYHGGTYYKDMAPGLNAFFTAVGTGGAQPAQNMTAATWGIDPAFGGLPEQMLISLLKWEVDCNRTAIAHFRHWNLNPVGPPANPGTGNEIDEYEFEIEEYEFDDWTPYGMHDEEWNDVEGEDGMGHAVLVVGYMLDSMGALTHLLVHDNYPATARNVQVPVGPELVAITIVQGFNLEIMNPLTAGATGIFEVTGGGGNSTTWLAYSLKGTGSTWIPTLGLFLDLQSPKQAGGVVTTDNIGYTWWSLPIPLAAKGRTVWFQAAQIGLKSNVICTVIQ